MIPIPEITVIIRSAGERTVQACKVLLEEVFPADQIHIIEEAPFSKALRRSLEIGLEEKRPWIACVDADVLINKEGVYDLIKMASNAPVEVFEVQGLILDKFFPVFRPAGIHLYKTKYAEKALTLKPEEGSTTRPESELLNSMAAIGFPWMQCDAVVGVHDFEQFYIDIFRKCFLQAHKHKSIIPHVIDFWLEQSLKDNDFKVALLGLMYGMSFNDIVKVDKGFKRDEANQIISRQGIAEKDNDCNVRKDFIKRLIQEGISTDFQNLQCLMMPLNLRNRIFYHKIQSRSRTTPGVVSKSFYKTGNIFILTGEFFRSLALKM